MAGPCRASAGTWTGIKCVKDTIESTAVIEGAVDRLSILAPTDFKMPLGGLNIRLLDNALSQEARLQEYKRDAILAFVRLNKLNRYITTGGRNPKIGVITTGKSYLDVRLAMDELGIDEVKANDLGIRLLKIACPGRSLARSSRNSPRGSNSSSWSRRSAR